MTDVVDLLGAKFFPDCNKVGFNSFVIASESVGVGDVIVLEGEGMFMVKESALGDTIRCRQCDCRNHDGCANYHFDCADRELFLVRVKHDA